MPPGSPEDKRTSPSPDGDVADNGAYKPEFDKDGGIHPTIPEQAATAPDEIEIEGSTESSPLVDARSKLLDQKQWDQASGCGSENCDHGTFVARATRPRFLKGYGSIATTGSNEGFGGRHRGDHADGTGGTVEDDETHNKMSITKWLAKRHNVKNPNLMFLFYYLPITNWIKQYRWSFVKGDLIAALTMASFYLPMALSYASNLGHIPPINGLYSFVFNPFIYAIFGTCPQMVVGPEAAGSLLTGQVVRDTINAGHHADWDAPQSAEIAGMVTGLAGAIILFSGLCRLGFLDSVLSRPFLRGFISAIGIVILVDQLIPEMGLDAVAKKVGGVSHGSSLDKILFLVEHGNEASKITCAMSFGAFGITMVLR